jgi:ATP-dependent Clp protease adaptor protein ClpS
MSEQIIIKKKEEVDIRLNKPRLYAVVIHNDDYTTMDFVVEAIVLICHKSVAEAAKIMLDVHEKGKGTVEVYPYDIAVTKKFQMEQLAREQEFPLQVSVEEAEL